MRIFCLEDNALVVLHLEMVIEEAGHTFAGSAASFAEARSQWAEVPFDLALVDIDLADGRTGLEAAEWLCANGRLGCFVTGQVEVAEPCRHLVVDVLGKPLDEGALRRALGKAQAELEHRAMQPAAT